MSDVKKSFRQAADAVLKQVRDTSNAHVYIRWRTREPYSSLAVQTRIP